MTDGATQRLAYSPAEAAALLGIARQTLYARMADGTVPSLILGRRRLIRAAALERLLAELEAAEAS